MWPTSQPSNQTVFMTIILFKPSSTTSFQQEAMQKRFQEVEIILPLYCHSENLWSERVKKLFSYKPRYASFYVLLTIFYFLCATMQRV